MAEIERNKAVVYTKRKVEFRKTKSNAETRNEAIYDTSVVYPRGRSGCGTAPLKMVKEWFRRSLPSLLSTSRNYAHHQAHISLNHSMLEHVQHSDHTDSDNSMGCHRQWPTDSYNTMSASCSTDTKLRYEELFPQLAEETADDCICCEMSADRDRLYLPKKRSRSRSMGSEWYVTLENTMAEEKTTGQQPSYLNIEDVVDIDYTANPPHYATLR